MLTDASGHHSESELGTIACVTKRWLTLRAAGAWNVAEALARREAAAKTQAIMPIGAGRSSSGDRSDPTYRMFAA